MTSHLRDLIGQDTPVGNDADTPGYAQPVSQTEIEELLYSEEWPIGERIGRLLELKAELLDMESPGFGDDDPKSLIREINAAVASLRGRDGEGMDPTSVDHDPDAHRETLSPDSDELEAIEQEDEDSLGELEKLDEAEWVDGDGFDPEKGVN